MMACFTSASVANRLPGCCFLKGLKSLKLLGPLLPTGLVTGYSTVWEVMSDPLFSPSFMPMWFPFFGPHKKHLAGKHIVRHQHKASCRLQTTDTSHWFLICQNTSLDGMVGQKVKCRCWLLGGLVCATTTHAVHQSQNKVLSTSVC